MDELFVGQVGQHRDGFVPEKGAHPVDDSAKDQFLDETFRELVLGFQAMADCLSLKKVDS